MFRRGCALGDERACGRVHAVELEKRCDRFSAVACKELAEASAELGGRYGDSVAEYEAVHQHMLMMADLLSNGIISQFPSRFR